MPAAAPTGHGCGHDSACVADAGPYGPVRGVCSDCYISVGPDFLLDARVVTLAMLTSFLQARRRSLAATVIQRAFRAWIDRFTDLIYIHIKCASTSEADELYRVALADALAAINVRLRWKDFDGFRTGHSSRLGKMARSRAGKRDYVVLGSHGFVKAFLLLRRPLTRLTRVCSWVSGCSE